MGIPDEQIEGTLGGLRIIKAFNAEKKIQDRFERSNDTFRQLTNRIYRRQQMAHPMSEFFGNRYDRYRTLVWRYADLECE